MIGYYFIQNKYIFVGNKEKDRDTDINGNDKYTKELTAQLAKKATKSRRYPWYHLFLLRIYNYQALKNLLTPRRMRMKT
jgi:hypothetical protein